jgi:hypothetical protein
MSENLKWVKILLSVDVSSSLFPGIFMRCSQELAAKEAWQSVFEMNPFQEIVLSQQIKKTMRLSFPSNHTKTNDQ